MKNFNKIFKLLLVCLLLASFMPEMVQARKILRNITGFKSIRYRYGATDRNVDGISGSGKKNATYFMENSGSVACITEDNSCCDRIKIIDSKSSMLLNTLRIQTEISDLNDFDPRANSYDKYNNALLLNSMDIVDLSDGKLLNNFGKLGSNLDMNYSRNYKASPDGKYLIGLLGKIDGKIFNGNKCLSSVYIFDSKTSQILDSFPHPQMVYDFVIREKSNELITYCNDSKIYIWDYASRKLKKTINYNMAKCQEYGYGNILLYQPANEDNLVLVLDDCSGRLQSIVYDLKNQKELYKWPMYDILFEQPAIAKTKNEICYLSLDAKTTRRDIITGAIIDTFDLKFIYPKIYHYINNDADLLIEDFNGAVFCYNFEEKRLRCIAPFIFGCISFEELDGGNIAILNDWDYYGGSIYSGIVLSPENTLVDRIRTFGMKAWNNQPKDMAEFYLRHHNENMFIRNVPGTKMLLLGDTAGTNNVLSLWDIGSNRFRYLNIKSKLPFTNVHFDEINTDIAWVSCLDSNLYKFDVKLNRVLETIKTNDIISVMSKIKDNRFFFVSDTGKGYSLNTFDLTTKMSERILNFRGSQIWDSNLGPYKFVSQDLYPNYCFSDDGNYFASFEMDQYDPTYKLNIYDLNTNDQPIYSFDLDSNNALCMDFSDDNRFLAIGGIENLFLINLENKKVRQLPLDFSGKAPYYSGEYKRFVTRIKLSKDNRKVTYITDEPSFIEEDISDLTDVEETVNISSSILKVFPNPTSGSFSFEFAPQTPSPTRIRILNILGETVYERSELLQVSMVSEINVDLTGLSSGAYRLTIENGGKISSAMVGIDK